MSRIEIIGNATLYLGDCREILPTLGKADAVLTDPPYGIGRDKGNETRSGSGFYAVQIRKQYADDWDYRPADDLFEIIIAAARISIIWGGNFFTSILPENGHWLVWDKQNTMPTFSDCELAWTNRPKSSVKVFRYSNNGLMAKEKNRVHPTQKPVELMAWCLEQMPNVETVIDPFMGSGTTGVAAVKLGRKFTGIEIEPKYFDIACSRIQAAVDAPDMFVARPSPPIQEAFDYDAAKDMEGSIGECYRAIKERVAAGGPGFDETRKPTAITGGKGSET
jgi:DNA modification methylase